MQLDLTVDQSGSLRAIWNDSIAGILSDLGEASIVRASHVEPEGTQWFADMAPSGGPKLGPFALRQEAIDAEVIWLKQERGL
jgi:hypothetical protein